MAVQVIVAGFHRSGTSLTAQILHRAGLFLGDRMLSEHASNPHGHFEDLEVLELHERILADNGLTWQVCGSSSLAIGELHRRQMQDLAGRRNAEHRLWGFKDPRVCLFLETWKEILPESKVLLVYRDPVRVCRSLHRRHAEHAIRGGDETSLHYRFWKVPDLALKMWLTYNRALLRFARTHREDVLAVSMDMLRDGLPLVNVLNERWELGLHEVPTSGVFDAGATARDREGHPVSNEDIISEAAEVWEELEEIGQRTRRLAGMPEALHRLNVGDEGLYVPREAYSHRMDAEFLSFKVRFLEELLKQEGKRFVPLKRLSELEAAERDLKYILHRMSRSRFAPLFRLKRGFRILEKRYLS
ncbi:hypothetical protein E0L93_00240 [Rubrobacter taiwanensis]|uniref:Sulfotransferase family protein n=1 Tax=Rubrobacter taiwanensis TaxID=185139 RepID=A0A4R1BTT1_9ACTN|nr:sulfotransferase [Rubrobacter taiwanensis]TCJ20696.1 hypothetical protein E0L93_00240 [Rubrobacter taiwanensis]